VTLIHWQEQGQAHSARWRSESGRPAPTVVEVVDDRITADAAYKLVCAGKGLLWRGDFQNARQLLQALMRRCDAKPARKKRGTSKDTAPTVPEAAFPQAFHLHRQAQAQRARLLSLLLIPVDADGLIPLRRAPDWRAACEQAWRHEDETVWNAATEQPSANTRQNATCVLALRELLGLVGAYEWHKNGVPIAALGGRSIHPAYGVFSPVRGEYLDLVAQAPLPEAFALMKPDALAFELGVGTGVLSALLAQRGVNQIIATDLNPRALRCAHDNLNRLGHLPQVTLLQADLYPPGDARADLVVCNPPWLPGRASSALEHAVYDENSQMLRGFLSGLNASLKPSGEGWLILSDLAEHLRLRTRAELLSWIEAAGLKVLARSDIKARHPKASDASDPLHQARQAELTSLWRLGH
jgi:methylase of polypeptide subunit release factors